MNKKPAKVRLAFYVEGYVEKKLIGFINQYYKLYKIVEIKKAYVSTDKSNLDMIIEEINEVEENMNFLDDSIIIMLFDEKLKINKKPSIVDIVQISKPSIDYLIGTAMGIKLNKNDKIENHKNAIKQKINFEKKNYLQKRDVEKMINFDIILDQFDKLGDYIKELIKIKNKNLNYKKTRDLILKIPINN